MFAQPRLADMAFICTQDAEHVRHACLALEKGYDLLLDFGFTTLVERQEINGKIFI